MWVQFVAAIDQSGQVIDVLVSVKRDLATTRRFFIRPGTWPRPSEVATDRDLPSESHDGEPTHHHERASRWFDGQIRRLAPHEATTDRPGPPKSYPDA